MTADPKNVTFVLMLIDDAPENFLMIRNVNEYATHYLGPDGMWQAWPEDENDLEELFITLKENPSMLPRFDIEAANQINEDLEADIDSDS